MSNRTPDETTVAVTAQALALIVDIAAKHPNLPAPYLSFSTHRGGTLASVQCQTLASFEAWRIAVGAAPEDVNLSAVDLYVDVPVTWEQPVKINLYVGSMAGIGIPRQRTTGEA